MSTIFDKILSGELPSHTVYQDEHVYSFLDINPISHGHTLVIPREAKERLHELSDESSAAIGRVLPRICRAVMSATGAVDYNILQNNGAPAHQAVLHVHFHVIPKFADQGLGVGWKTEPLGDESARELIASMQQSLGTLP
jgi:histidine triad (HIT) family protein